MNFTGVQALHKPTNMLVTGAVDDLRENARGELIVVDYESTAKDGDKFDQTPRFRMTMIAYDGRDDWVEPHIMAARECLLHDTPPAPATKCPHCSFAAERLAYAAKAN